MGEGEKDIRFLDFSRVDGFVGLGLRQLLVESVGKERSLPTYATVNYKSPFISIGPSQDIDSVLDVEKCLSLGVDIVRRSSASGGAIFYDGGINEYLVVGRDFFPNIDCVTEYCRKLFAHVANKFGYPEIQYTGNDMRWKGKKVGGFASMATQNTFMAISFFNLRRPDIESYMKFTRSPMQKFSDKSIKDMAEYIATPEDLIIRCLSYEEVRDAFVNSVKEILGANLIPDELSKEEEGILYKIVKEMKSDSWVFRYSSNRRFATIPRECMYGVGFFKGKKLVQVNMLLDNEGKNIEDIVITGDHMISPPSILDLMSLSIKGMNVDDETGILKTLAEILCNPQVEQSEATKLNPEDFLQAIKLARENAIKAIH